MSKADSKPSVQPKLAAPGAGLPLLQATFLRYLFFPAFCMTVSWDKALKMFSHEGEKLTTAAKTLSPEQLQIPVLIRAPMGIEDSSRNWSAAMVLEHLIEVGSRIAIGVVELTQDQPVSVKADIVEVKPRGMNNEGIISRYESFLKDYQEKVVNQAGNHNSKNTIPHPWFGELNPHQWVCLAAIHQQIHRRQMTKIITGLQKKSP